MNIKLNVINNDTIATTTTTTIITTTNNNNKYNARHNDNTARVRAIAIVVDVGCSARCEASVVPFRLF